MDYIKYALNKNKTSKFIKETELFSEDQIKRVYKFHASMGEAYNQTPLVNLDAFAHSLKVSKFFVKDESKRGDLKAFKLLGGAYAVANCICKKLNIDIDDIDFNYLKSEHVKQKLGNLVFAAASDGNHGKSVAWAANEFNQKAIVYMPKGTAQDRIDAIENLGGTVIVSDHTYDWCVREVDRLAQEKGWEVVLDTASKGDTQVATWVMQGYSTMGWEVINQLKSTIPTHMFLQAGVGSMAAAMIAVFANHYKNNCPRIYILEPHKAACFYASGIESDGKAYGIKGEMDSIMAGLSCGVPNPIAWEIIRNFADGFFSCDDILTANGMRILANPLGNDEKIVSGESGAIGTGFIDYIMKNQPSIADELGLDTDSKILVFSTEGDTDTQNYTDIVWYGK
ncbi:MAG: diaminopropionate ammonia-lyase [Clostridiales bacterium]|nr:diaminopropionate ammonia-lyase [Clostridiales bacterium]